MTGFGAVSPTVEDGQLPPAGQPAEALTRLSCTTSKYDNAYHLWYSVPLETGPAALFPWMVGYYTIPLRVSDATHGGLNLRCGIAAGWIPVH